MAVNLSDCQCLKVRRWGQLDMNIGQAILEIRKERDLKQETVGLEADTDSGYMSRIESGDRTPSLAMLEKIALAMGVSVTQIVAKAEGISFTDAQKDERGEVLSEEAAQLLQQFRSLSAENQRLTVELVKTIRRNQEAR